MFTHIIFAVILHIKSYVKVTVHKICKCIVLTVKVAEIKFPVMWTKFDIKFCIYGAKKFHKKIILCMDALELYCFTYRGIW
jgi:hypothetical protein